MKGLIHTLEVVIALIMMATAASWMFSNVQTAQSTIMITQKGYHALEYLDKINMLRPAAANYDTNSIKNNLDSLITDFDIEICNPICSGTNRQGASAIDYFIAGYLNFAPVHIRVYMW